MKLVIPQTPEELQEMLSDPKKIEALQESGQYGEVLKAYGRALAKSEDTRGQMADIVSESVQAAFTGEGAAKAAVEKIVSDAFEV